ncbi:NeuD/PglB/VioB family sugar acetyltransferase [Sinomonas sp. ASV322]|uniref:NeuD/PglB/VioB family sugar acetyltransferase n=1 Tax=Sinomonas sp. ASV322 TaxID=3041920 RepID=UPI0027DDE25B|nr:NeuD/PglB/VioB family sugar acetyltransferase [Sinomonas sp. ASV322]MDQ4504335.1 NeuD/PglB/VioB family sugar acetyltransferase [Sinomonas sp. ASV322]
MTELLIVAASGLAREVMALVRGGDDFDLLGILDDDPVRVGSLLDGAHVLGPLAEVRKHPNARLVVCVGSGAIRADIVRRLAALGLPPGRFATIIHPSAIIPEGCSVGEGSILLANVVMTAAVTLGRHVVVMPGVTLTHGDFVDDYATFGAGVAVGGSVVVGRAAYLGMNSSIRQRTRVGARAVVGMGAAVVSDVPEGQTWVGVPARPMSGVVAGPTRGVEP